MFVKFQNKKQEKELTSKDIYKLKNRELKESRKLSRKNKQINLDALN